MATDGHRGRLLRARRIGIVRTDRLGDMVLTLPMFAALRTRCPEAELHLLCRRYAVPLAEGLSIIDRIHSVDELPNGIGSVLDGERFDVVFLPHMRGADCWKVRRAGVPLRVGSAYRWYSWLLNHRIRDHRSEAKFHEEEYNTRLIESVLGEKVATVLQRPVVNAAAAARVAERLAGKGIGPENGLIVLHPGTGGSSYDWSAERFGLLGAALAGGAGTRIVVTGIESERALCETVERAAGSAARVVSLCGELDLTEMIALLDRTTMLAANSTGVLHVAAALGTPVLGFYPLSASHSPARWGPYTSRAVVVSPPADQPDAMELITVEAALNAARRLLSETAR
ncbi:MAG TPA: glycosyltransferase family 9 protein [Gemmatimonadales bacterium]|nr:glycosyltransferase family 9 protein [Gemmatimonadales bacterium]